MPSATVTFTRPADTTAYLANDVVGAASAVLEFTTLGIDSIIITSTVLEIDASATISGETSYNLHLYKATPPSALADNAPHDIPAGDRDNYLGVLNLGTPLDAGSTLHITQDGVNRHIKMSRATLYAYLVTVGAYAPTSERVYRITLHAVQA
jgi:hypothetical protein